MIPYIHSSLVPINPHTQKVSCAVLASIYTIFGVKYGYLHVLNLPPLSFMSCIPVINISPFGKDHFIQNQVPDHVIGLIHKYTSIITCILIENTLNITSELIFHILSSLFMFCLANTMCVHRL